MLEAGALYPVISAIMGWSASTTVRMAKCYKHIGQQAQRQAVAALSGANFRRMGHRFYDFEPTAPDRRLEFIHNVPGCLSRDRFFGL